MLMRWTKVRPPLNSRRENNMAYDSKAFGKDAWCGAFDIPMKKGNTPRPQWWAGEYTFNVNLMDNGKEHVGLAPQQKVRPELPPASKDDSLLAGQYSQSDSKRR